MIRLPAIATLAVLLAACTAVPRQEPPAQPRALRVATLNVYHDAADWPARLPLIIDGLRALDADVIALQEVLQTPTLPNQAGTIGAALGYSVQFVSIDPEDQDRRYGNALLTRLPVESRDWTRLAPLDDARTLGRARVTFDGHPVDVYFTHLHWRPDGGAIRRQQLDTATDWIRHHGDDAVPALILGDFNAPASAPEFKTLADFVDSYGVLHPTADADGATTLNPQFFPDLRARIDLVFAQRGRFEIREARIVLDVPDASGNWPSDHFGIFVVLQPRASATSR